MTRLLPALVRHWVAWRLTGERRPLLAGFKLTHRCNLRCHTCPFWRRPRPDVSFAGVCAALARLSAAGCRVLILEGGEPFLWRDGEHGLEDVVQAARASGFSRVGITTNGTLPIATSADIVWVSFDGLQETHETIRGPCWERILTNIATSRHPRIFAQITISRANWREIPDLIRFLADRVRGVTFQFFYPYPESADLWLPWPERAQVLRELAALKRQGYPVLDSFRALRDLADNRWRCHEWLIADAEPDPHEPGQAVVHHGCYLKGRAEADCKRCGFAAHTELSLAFDLHPGALWTGQQVFRFVG